MKLKKMNWIGIIASLIILVVGAVFFYDDQNLFFFLIGIALTVFFLPIVFGIMLENKKEQQINEMFLEFSRNLAESVATGTPISRSIILMRKNNYGPLTPNVQKLANQIDLGIPVSKALETFANDVNSTVIRRAISLIKEAERAGGEIDYILESTAKSISEIEKLKKERKSSIYNLVVQGYIIFFIFVGIMLVMQFKILPLAINNNIGGFSTDITNVQGIPSGSGVSVEELSRPFLYLLLAQGIFAGLTIGKLAEGSVKAGIKHSFIMTIAAFLIATGAKLLLS